MRVLNAQAGDEGHAHPHSHSHSHSHGSSTAKSTSVDDASDKSGLRSRTKDETSVSPPESKKMDHEVNPSLKLSAYLNLFGDFTHNITDGLAMAASFYSSPALGAVTTIATFCHEIPHEVGHTLSLGDQTYRAAALNALDRRLLYPDQVGFHEITSDGIAILHRGRGFRRHLFGHLDCRNVRDRQGRDAESGRGAVWHHRCRGRAGHSYDSGRSVGLSLTRCDCLKLTMAARRLPLHRERQRDPGIVGRVEKWHASAQGGEQMTLRCAKVALTS